MNIKINGNKTIMFTAQGISYVLDTLTEQPWKIADPLIRDILIQLKAQENVGEDNGPSTS